MSENTCALCLGGPEDTPPLGTLKDAQDIISPCSTCSLTTHRKCLIDWLNSLPTSQITQEFLNADGSDTEQHTRPGDTATIEPIVETDNDNDNEPDIMHVSFRSRWISVLGQYSSERIRGDVEDDPMSNSPLVYLSAACPQCKSKIKFRMRRLALLTLNSFLRISITNMVQYSIVFFGITGAATGITTMGYVGLIRCGISIMDAVVPASLIGTVLGAGRIGIRRSAFAFPASLQGSDSSPSQIMLSQLRSQYVPLLPVVLYRMRRLLVLNLIFPQKYATMWSDLAAEVLICNYFSALGNHKFAAYCFQKIRQIVAPARRLTRTVPSLDWTDPHVLLGAIIPAKWLYDIVYRLTFNQVHFNLALRTRPLDIENSLSSQEVYNLECIQDKIRILQKNLRLRLNSLIQKEKEQLLASYFWLRISCLRILRERPLYELFYHKAWAWFYRLKACVKHDYSSSLLYRLAVMTGVTTVLWPFVSADVGRVLVKYILRSKWGFATTDKDKLTLMANLIAMFIVAVAKDAVNVAMNKSKANQLQNLGIITGLRNRTSTAPPTSNLRSYLPGTFNIN